MLRHHLPLHCVDIQTDCAKAVMGGAARALTRIGAVASNLASRLWHLKCEKPVLLKNVLEAVKINFIKS